MCLINEHFIKFYFSLFLTITLLMITIDFLYVFVSVQSTVDCLTKHLSIQTSIFPIIDFNYKQCHL